jgi:hypothetical protein
MSSGGRRLRIESTAEHQVAVFEAWVLSSPRFRCLEAQAVAFEVGMVTEGAVFVSSTRSPRAKRRCRIEGATVVSSTKSP